jgi:hypothetical protein
MSAALEDLDAIDDTPAVQALFSNLRSALPELQREDGTDDHARRIAAYRPTGCVRA